MAGIRFLFAPSFAGGNPRGRPREAAAKNMLVGMAMALLCGPVTLTAEPARGRLANLSIRARLVNSDEALVAGFVLAGEDAKPILIRGVGPGLAGFGVTAAFDDPELSLHAGSALLSSNNDWSDASGAARLAATAAGIGAFALGPGSRDAAMLPNLAAGNYTARLSGRTAAAGDALLEVYDAATGQANPRLVNLSALGRIGGTSSTLLAGFVIMGSSPRRVLVRGVGPSLALVGVSDAASDPQIALFAPGKSQPSMRNDNWGGTDALKKAFATAGAFSLSGGTSRDAALIATLAPGAYTVELSAVGTGAGLALIEIYDVTAEATMPEIALEPRSLTVAAGAAASFTVIATSAAPLNYQWQKDGIDLPGATDDILRFDAAGTADAGVYRALVSNPAGSIRSAPATLALIPPRNDLPPASTFELVGFATLGNGTTGGGVLTPGNENYHVLDRAIANPAQQLRAWLESPAPLVVDVQTDVDLGALANVPARPRTNPELIASGVGVINVRSNKTLISSNGSTLQHGTLNLSGQSNIIIRNLRFRGLWEFDEGSQDPPNDSPWGYKIQDWDYIDVQNNARNVWIDHCDFEKSYDGIADTKLGADLVTFSWCRLGGDTEGVVERQIAYLEKLYQGQLSDSRVSYAFYQGLRDGAYAARGIPRQSVAAIVAHERPHDKCNLVGAADNETVSIGCLNVTFHHVYYHDCRQRLPRMRFGNAHVFNLHVDNSGIADGTNQGTATTCNAAIFAENNRYVEVALPFPAASGSSPPGRITQSGCTWMWRGTEMPLSANAFLEDPATWTWNLATRNFAWTVAPPPNAFRLPYSYLADSADYVRNHPGFVGVIVPAGFAEQAKLAEYLVRTRAN